MFKCIEGFQGKRIKVDPNQKYGVSLELKMTWSAGIVAESAI